VNGFYLCVMDLGLSGRRAAVAAAAEALGGVDILVTNAGGPPPGTFASTRLDGGTYAGLL